MSDSIEVARRYLDLFNSRDVTKLASVVSPEITYSLNGAALPPGRATLERRLAVFDEGTPDVQISVDEVIADGNRIGVRYTARGTHTGPLRLPMGEIQPSGKEFSYSGAAFLTITDGQVTAEDSVADLMSALRSTS